MAISPDSYLFHLGLRRFKPDLTYLKELQRAHQERIPLENFDVFLGRKRPWDLSKLYHKIIREKRGGLGLELNAIFGELLSQLGFRTKYVALHANKDRPQAITHMALLVHIAGDTWLVDVGREEQILAPDRLTKDQVALNYSRYVKFYVSEAGVWAYQRSEDAVHFSPAFFFRPRESKLIEFVHLHDVMQDRTHESAIAEKRISRIKEGGRLILTEANLQWQQGRTLLRSEPIQNEAHFDIVLMEEFGISWRKLIQQEGL
ncbi:MAG: arylamine N-acetyltransferase [Bacteroidota bacterium]